MILLKQGQKTKYVDPHVAGAWQNSHDGTGFKALLESKGYDLAQGRNRMVAVDPYGKIFNPIRHLEGVSTKAFNERTTDLEVSQLPLLEKIVEQRKATADAYDQRLQTMRNALCRR